MIKLSDIPERGFEIELEDGTIRSYDLIDLMKDLSDLFGVVGGEDLNQAQMVGKVAEVKNIFKIEGLSSYRAFKLLEGVQDAFDLHFGEVADTSELKKKHSTNASESADFVISDSEKQQNSPQEEE